MTTPENPKKEKRPPKKRPRNLSPASQQRYELESLLAKPDQEIIIPSKDNHSDLLPPDILLNIQGSSAGAGSGEFHVYKAARKRELERIQKFEEEIEREISEKRFLKEREEKNRLLAEKTAKNRKRRDKKKKKEDGDGDGNEKGIGVGLKVPPLNRLDQGDEKNGDGEDIEEVGGLIVIEDN
jgi:Protein of unknown function (DUF1168)